MEDMNVAPVNHGLLSSTGNVALGAAGGAVKSGISAMMTWTGLFALTGAVLAGTVVALGATTLVVAAPTILLATVAGGLGAGILGLTTSSFAGVIGAALGGFSGASKAITRVGQERGAANVMQAQVATYMAQAQMQAAAADKYNFPPQGSAMNAAGSTISSVQNDGRTTGDVQLQRA